MSTDPLASRRTSPGAGSNASGFDRVGTTLVVVGCVLILSALTLLNWFREGSGFFGGAGSHSTFSDLHDLLRSYTQQAAGAEVSSHVSFGASRSYFGWLGWLLLFAAGGCGALARSSFGAAHFVVRWLGAVVAVTGFAVTLLAINLITFEGNAPNNADAPSYGDYLANSGPGTWFALAGYVFILVGCLVSRGDG
jgi:hypothetical protein